MSTHLNAIEQAAADALAVVMNRHEVAARNTDSWTATDFTEEALAVAAAVQKPIEDQLGRDLMEEGLESVLHRLVGEKHAMFVLNLVRAEAIEAAAAREFNAATPTDGRLRARLYSRAAEVRSTPLPGSPLAMKATSEETRDDR